MGTGCVDILNLSSGFKRRTQDDLDTFEKAIEPLHAFRLKAMILLKRIAVGL